MSIETKFPLAIYHARTGKELTQAEVAEEVDISTRWYQVIESGRRLPGVRTAIKLMAFLDISAKDLDGEEKK